MKRQCAAVLIMCAMFAFADNSVTIRRVGGGINPNASNAVLATVKGQAFESKRQDIVRIVNFLGSRHVWSDYGPDAAFYSAEIVLDGKTYTINSWYPLHRQDETLAVSEKWGLRSVSGKSEKMKIESQNSEMYRALVSIFEIGRGEPQQSAPPVSGTRGTPAAYAPVVPGIPER